MEQRNESTSALPEFAENEIVGEKQLQANELIKQLDTFNDYSTDVDEVLEWLVAFQEASSQASVFYNREAILKKLLELGYATDMHTGTATEKEDAATRIINQALSDIENNVTIRPEIKAAYEDWKNMQDS